MGTEEVSMCRPKAKEKDEKKHFPKGFSRKFKGGEGDDDHIDLETS